MTKKHSPAMIGRVFLKVCIDKPSLFGTAAERTDQRPGKEKAQQIKPGHLSDRAETEHPPAAEHDTQQRKAESDRQYTLYDGVTFTFATKGLMPPALLCENI